MASMLKILLLVLLGVIIGGTAGAVEAGQSARELSGFMRNEVLVLVVMIGGIACLYTFFFHNKMAAIFMFVGLLFIAAAKVLITGWFNPDNAGGMPGFILPNVGPFPFYGQDPETRLGGEDAGYSAIQTWCYIGASFCHSIISIMTWMGIPLMVALAGGIWTYWQLAVKQQTGSVLKYFIVTMLVAIFCWFPTTTFRPLDAPEENQLIQALNNVSTSANFQTSTGDAGSISIPMLPAMLFVTGTDITTALGKAMNPSPASSYSRRIQESAMSAVPPSGWAQEYTEFARACGSASRSFLDVETAYREVRTSGTGYDFRAQDTTVLPILQRARDITTNSSASSSSHNALSPLGDLLLMNVPMDAYLIDDPANDLPTTFGMFRQNVQESFKYYRAESSNSRSITAATKFLMDPTIEQVTSSLRASRINSFDIPMRASADGRVATPRLLWTSPIVLGKNQDLMELMRRNRDGSTMPFALRYCTTSRNESGGLRFPSSAAGNSAITIPLTDSSPSAPVESLGAINDPTFNSLYLASFWQNAPVQNGNLRLTPYDMSIHVRKALLGFYTVDTCKPACGNPGHANHFGCLITGQFVKIYNDGSGEVGCKTDADATNFFYHLPYAGLPAGSGEYAQWTLDSTLRGIPADLQDLISQRSLPALVANASSAAAPATTTWSMGATTAAVDIIMASPGFANAFGAGASGLSGASSDGGGGGAESAIELGFSKLWSLLSGKGIGEYLVMLLVWIATYVIKLIWGHFMGISLMVLQIIYPFFALLALWPGMWKTLLDWCLAACWIMIWPVFIALGLAFINGGGTVMEQALTVTAAPSPSSIVLAIIGICLVLMAPVFAQAIITPSFATASKLGSVVYGTGFKVLGAAAVLATAAVGAGLAVGGAVAGGALGAGMKGAGSLASQGAGAMGGGGGAGGDAPPAPSRKSMILSNATRYAKAGQSIGRGLGHAVTATAAAADMLGAHGVASGAGVGQSMADVGYKAEAEVGAGATAAGRAAARRTLRGMEERGEDPQKSRIGRMATDISRDSAGALSGSALGRFIESEPRAGGADLGGLIASHQASAKSLGLEAQRAERDGNRSVAQQKYEALAVAQTGLARLMRSRGDMEGAALATRSAAAATSSAALSSEDPDWQSVFNGQKRAMVAAKEMEQTATLRGDAPMAHRSREIQGSLHLSTAEAGYRWADQLDHQAKHIEQRYIAGGRTDDALRREMNQTRHQAEDHRRQAGQEARYGLDIFSGAAARHSDGLMSSARLAVDPTNAEGFNGVMGHSAALASMMAQSQGLASLAPSGDVTVPVQLQEPRVRAVLQQARVGTGSVAAMIIGGTEQAVVGDFNGAAQSFNEAVTRARNVGMSRMATEHLEVVAREAGEGDFAAMTPSARADRIASGTSSPVAGVHRSLDHSPQAAVEVGKAKG